MNTLKLANQLYRQKKFKAALELFEKSALLYGRGLVDANIKLCLKGLRSESSVNQYENIKNSGNEINSYFDKIYLVNLKREAKRRLSVSLHLKLNGVKFHLHEATNGYEGEPFRRFEAYKNRRLGDFNRYPDFKEMEIKRGKPFIESAGAFGYIFTYLSILKDAKEKGYKRILILEDDVILCESFHYRFYGFIEKIPADWKILQLGASQYNWESVQHDEAVSQGFYFPRQLHTCGSFAIALDSSVFDELIEAESAFESPFDHLALGELYERHVGKCFVCYPNIVMPDVGSSSIRGGRDQHAHAKKMRWNIEEFQYPLPSPSIAIFIQNSKNIKYIDKFEAEKPYEMRVYINTSDGPRPVHNNDIFLKANYEPVFSSLNVEIPSVDFAVEVESSAVISEGDILQYLDSCLCGGDNNTSLKSAAINPIVEIKGRVSVIIPTYMRPYNLSKAIKSVAAQDYHDLEIIVVSDNGENSEFNKETVNIVESFKRDFPSLLLKIISHKHNRNGAAARNTGILQSSGEYICFLDDDDIYLDRRISDSIRRIVELPDTVGAVYCGFLGWNSPVNDEKRYKAGDLTEDLLMLNYKNHYLHTNTATYRRSALLALNGFDETYRRHQDIELNLRFFEKFEVDFVKTPGVRLNPEPSVVSNKVFNADMIELKQKFLTQFGGVINEYDYEVRKTIYRRQWEEVKRYTTDIEATKKYFESLLSNGPLQVSLLLREQMSALEETK